MFCLILFQLITSIKIYYWHLLRQDRWSLKEIASQLSTDLLRVPTFAIFDIALGLNKNHQMHMVLHYEYNTLALETCKLGYVYNRYTLSHTCMLFSITILWEQNFVLHYHFHHYYYGRKEKPLSKLFKCSFT